MKRIVIAVLLALAAAPAWADWVKVSEDDRDITYVERATIRKQGDLRRYWELNDLKKRARNGEMSRRVQWECNCKQGRCRGLSAVLYSEPMAGGTILDALNAPSEWRHIASGTTGAKIRNFVCAK